MKESLFHILLRALRRIFFTLRSYFIKKVYPRYKEDFNNTSEVIISLLTSDKPCMIARYGAFEISSMVNSLGVRFSPHNPFLFILGKIPEWWWLDVHLKKMKTNAGFFPSNSETIDRFTDLMLHDSAFIDLLGSWRKEEFFLNKYLNNVQRVPLLTLEPFFATVPWTIALKGKKVLVIHPFSDLIESQYNKRLLLFDNPTLLPDFTLFTIKAEQSIDGISSRFNDWFEALSAMKKQMDCIDYDIALIGCGAYGFPLAAHAKRMGKKAVHLGGALQLLFGIKGKRWEDPNYAIKWHLPVDVYTKLLSRPGWVRPSDDLKPPTANNVEGGCYW